jgi:hypothetical protein
MSAPTSEHSIAAATAAIPAVASESEGMADRGEDGGVDVDGRAPTEDVAALLRSVPGHRPRDHVPPRVPDPFVQIEVAHRVRDDG